MVIYPVLRRADSEAKDLTPKISDRPATSFARILNHAVCRQAATFASVCIQALPGLACRAAQRAINELNENRQIGN